MNEKVTSILFLAIVVLVFVGFVVGITLALVKRLGRGGAFKSAAAKYGWVYVGNSSDAISAVEEILEKTVYQIQPGKHEVSCLTTGRRGGIDFRLVRYHYQTVSTLAGHGRGGVYTLLILGPGTTGTGDTGEQRGASTGFWFMHRPKGKLAGAATVVASAVSGLSVPPDPAWEWSLFSSLEAFDRMGFDGAAGHTLEERTEPGDAVFVYPGAIILGRQGEFSAAMAAAVPGMIANLMRLLSK